MHTIWYHHLTSHSEEQYNKQIINSKSKDKINTKTHQRNESQSNRYRIKKDKQLYKAKANRPIKENAFKK